MDANLARNPEPPSPEDKGLAAARSEFGATIAALASYCKVPSVITEKYLLWFSPDEVDAVNKLWTAKGIDQVIERWGQERRYHKKEEELDFRPGDESAQVQARAVDSPVPIRLLTILRMEQPSKPDKKQSNYYRAAPFPISEHQELALVELLKTTKLLEDIVPKEDTELKVKLHEDDISAARCALTWYGPTNMYGKGVEFGMSLTLAVPTENGTVDARIAITEQGYAHAYLFAQEFVETGYEGHDHRQVELTEQQLRALKTFISAQKVEEFAARGYNLGFWLGNSFID